MHCRIPTCSGPDCEAGTVRQFLALPGTPAPQASPQHSWEVLIEKKGFLSLLIHPTIAFMLLGIKENLMLRPSQLAYYMLTQQNQSVSGRQSSSFWWPSGTSFLSTWAWLLVGTGLHGLAAGLSHLFPVSLTFSEISFINCFQYLNTLELFVQPFTLAVVIYTQPSLYRTKKLANPPLAPFSFLP